MAENDGISDPSHPEAAKDIFSHSGVPKTHPCTCTCTCTRMIAPVTSSVSAGEESIETEPKSQRRRQHGGTNGHL